MTHSSLSRGQMDGTLCRNECALSLTLRPPVIKVLLDDASPPLRIVPVLLLPRQTLLSSWARGSLPRPDIKYTVPYSSRKDRQNYRGAKQNRKSRCFPKGWRWICIHLQKGARPSSLGQPIHPGAEWPPRVPALNLGSFLNPQELNTFHQVPPDLQDQCPLPFGWRTLLLAPNPAFCL